MSGKNQILQVECSMRYFEIFEDEHPLITSANTTVDIAPNQTKVDAKKYGSELDNDFAPPEFYEIKDKNFGIEQDDEELEYSAAWVNNPDKQKVDVNKQDANPDIIRKNARKAMPTMGDESSDLTQYTGKTISAHTAVEYDTKETFTDKTDDDKVQDFNPGSRFDNSQVRS